jgi:hypothetical protein
MTEPAMQNAKCKMQTTPGTDAAVDEWTGFEL